jgi:hypothetical protein
MVIFDVLPLRKIGITCCLQALMVMFDPMLTFFHMCHIPVLCRS